MDVPTRTQTRASNDPDYTKWMSRRTYCRRMVNKYQDKCKGGGQHNLELSQAKLTHYETQLAESEAKLADVRSRLPLKKRRCTEKSESPKNSDSEGEHSSSEEFDLN